MQRFLPYNQSAESVAACPLVLLSLLCTLLAWGCDRGDLQPRAEFGRSKALDHPSRLAAADSSGYGALIVHNRAPSPDSPAFRVAMPPVIRVGGRNDDSIDAELWDVTDAVLTTGGLLIVAMDGGREISVFDRSNRFVRGLAGKFAQRGQGPGEFHEVSDLFLLPGDSLVISDRIMGRVSVYDAAFRFARSVPRTRYSVCCLAGGAFLVRQDTGRIVTRFWPEGRPLHRWGIVRPGDRSDLGTHLVTLEGDDPHQLPVVNWSAGESLLNAHMATVPFVRAAHVVAAGERIIHATGDYYEYRVYSLTGALERVVRADAALVRPSAEDIEWARTVFTQVESKTRRRLLEDKWDRARIPRYLPAFSRILSDEDGNVWVRNYSPPRQIPDSVKARVGSQNEWWAKFDSAGKLQGTIRVPDWHSVIAFTRGHVVLRHVEHVDGFTWITVHRTESLH